MAKEEVIFAGGLYFELPSGNTPSFIKGKLSINVEEFKKFLNDHQNKGGYVNIDLKESKAQKGYAVLNTWKPTDRSYKTSEAEDKKFDKDFDEQAEKEAQGAVPLGEGVEYPEEKINPEDIPF